ncbi:MAG: hypothetical protein AAF620_17710 [Bacteroidota bacterium]
MFILEKRREGAEQNEKTTETAKSKTEADYLELGFSLMKEANRKKRLSQEAENL